jgi:hypothetical protein
MPLQNESTILLAILAVTGVAVFLQTVILFGLYMTARKAAHTVETVAEEFRASAMPVLQSSREVLERSKSVLSNVAPNVESGAKDFAEIAHNLRAQTGEMQGTVTELVEKFRVQTARLDAMLTTSLDTVDRVTESVTQAVSGPARQVSSLLAGFRAAMQSMRGGDR